MDPTEFILPLAGIGLIVVLVWLTGGGKLAPMTESSARESLCAEGLQTTRIVVGTDGSVGLAWLDDPDRIALLRRMGADINITLLCPGDLKTVAWNDSQPEVSLRFRGMGQPGVRVAFGDSGELDDWRRLLAVLGVPKEASQS